MKKLIAILLLTTNAFAGNPAIWGSVGGTPTTQLLNNKLCFLNGDCATSFAAGSMSIGSAIVGGTAPQGLYIGSGNVLASDSNFTRVDTGQFNSKISSLTYAQASSDDGPLTGYLIQADNFGSNPTVTFDGVSDTNTIIAAHNIANPADTITVLLGGTNIPIANTVTLLGGGPSGIKTGIFDELAVAFQGTGIYSEDTSSSDVAVGFSGNISPLFGSTVFGGILGRFGNAGDLSILAGVKDVGIFVVTDSNTYQSQLFLDHNSISISHNGSLIGVDGFLNNFVFSDNSSQLLMPFGQTPSLGDVLTITNISGTDYTMEFQPSGGTVAGLDTYIQYNDGGIFGADSNFTWDKTDKHFMAGASNMRLDLDASSDNFHVDSPLGIIALGDNYYVSSGVNFNINGSTNQSRLSGAFPVDSSHATITQITGSGLNDIVVGGTWFLPHDETYTATVSKLGVKAFYVTLGGSQINVGDTIANQSALSETAVVISINQNPYDSAEYWVIADQSGGVWGTTPVSIQVTAGVNVGATASTPLFYQNTDCFNLSSSTVNATDWPMTSSLNINGGVIGWGAATNHTIGNQWNIRFAADKINFFDASFQGKTFDIGIHTTYPQQNKPKGMRFNYESISTSTLKIGNIVDNTYMLTFGQNSDDGIMYYKANTNDRFVDIQRTNGIYKIGDNDGTLNGNYYYNNDPNGIQTFAISDIFQIIDTASSKRLMQIDLSNDIYFLGDADALTNGNYIAVNNAANYVELKAADQVKITDGIIRGNALHNNAIAQGNSTQQDVRSGTYTPTLTNISNTSARTSYQSQWTRVGNVVTVSGKLDASLVLNNTQTQISIGLPIASNFSAEQNCAGTAHSGTTGRLGGMVRGNATSDECEMDFDSDSQATGTMFYTFTYLIQ